MRQKVTIHRSADRHAETHERDFADTREVTVESGLLASVVVNALHKAGVAREEAGKVIIEVGWPYEPEDAQAWREGTAELDQPPAIASQLDKLHEGCEKRGGICDCNGRQCALEIREGMGSL